MKIPALVLAAGLVLSACTPTTEVASNGQTSAAITSCTQRGGEMTPVGRAQTLQCILTFADAGKPCTDGSQCQGDCLSEVRDQTETGQVQGQCAPTSNRFGCRTKIENGVAQPTLCID